MMDKMLEKNPSVDVQWVVFLAWLIPGGGYWYLGKAFQGTVLFILLCSLFCAGMEMAAWANVSLTRQPYYFCGQILLGAPCLVALLLTLHLQPPTDLDPFCWELGCLYTCIAALLNGLVVLHTWQVAMEKKE